MTVQPFAGPFWQGTKPQKSRVPSHLNIRKAVEPALR
jgi:hypothetical protein